MTHKRGRLWKLPAPPALVESIIDKSIATDVVLLIMRVSRFVAVHPFDDKISWKSWTYDQKNLGSK